MKKYSLGTALKSASRVKGWKVTSALRQTVSRVVEHSPEEIPELVEAIKKELLVAYEKKGY